jgi:hypothetical protein
VPFALDGGQLDLVNGLVHHQLEDDLPLLPLGGVQFVEGGLQFGELVEQVFNGQVVEVCLPVGLHLLEGDLVEQAEIADELLLKRVLFLHQSGLYFLLGANLPL